LKEFLQSKEDEMLLLLERLVNIDSGSANKAGIDEVGGILKSEYENLGFTVEVVHEPNNGNNLLIQYKNTSDPEIIVVAHMDTVFKVGTASERPFSIKEGRAYGPGVIDMKASQVSLLYAVKSLIANEQTGFKNLRIVLNSDEEIGSPTSKDLIEQQATGKKYALIMEPARKDGSLVTARRGGGEYSLYVTGKAAHSGIEPQNGISAIEELAHKIIKLHTLTNHEEGITVNVGLIEGGESVNTIAPTAVGHIDIRINKMEQAAVLAKQIEDICSVSDIPGTTLRLEGGIDRPPLVKTDKTIQLLDRIKKVGATIGIDVTDTATGGASDASFTSVAGVPTIDGLGPIGGDAHTEKEYLEIPSFIERTELLANVIEKLSINE